MPVQKLYRIPLLRTKKKMYSSLTTKLDFFLLSKDKENEIGGGSGVKEIEKKYI